MRSWGILSFVRSASMDPNHLRKDSRSARVVPVRRAVIAICLALCTLGLRLSASALEHIISFDIKGAGTGAGQGTIPESINPAGVIVGQYIDAANAYHGFVRSPGGEITTFDVPGAGTSAGEGTLPWSINPEGEVTGYYTDATGFSHGFVRTPWGAITTFDTKDAGIPVGVPCSPPIICSNGTQGASTNLWGAVAGQYVDTGDVFHGFVRSPLGAIATFDAPGAGTGSGQGTFITFGDGLNFFGAILGGYADASNIFHGFVRDSDGAITPFDPIGSQFTDPAGINDGGVITGFYAKASGPYHGFLRFPGGEITSFDLSGAGTESSQGTEPLNINALGNITGLYVDSSGVDHGFLRTKDGAVTTFDAPGAGAGNGQGTIPDCNNPADAITGYYIDSSGVYHGFLRNAPGQGE